MLIIMVVYICLQEVAAFLTNAKKARRLNNYVFSLLRACAPQEDRLASMIKQSGVVVHSIKYPVTPSLLNHLPLKGTIHITLQPFHC